MKKMMNVFFALFVLGSFACGDMVERDDEDRYSSGPNCKKGKPCGNSCISRDKTCRIGLIEDF